MILKKLFALLAIVIATGLVFTACNDTTSTTDSPVVDTVAPTTGVPGDVITITGSNFGDYAQGTSKVLFGELEGTIVVDGSTVQWTSTEIKAKVPSGAGSCQIYVVSNGKTSNGSSFSVPSVNPPTGIQATSKDDKSVILKWMVSTDESKAGFSGYILTIKPKGGAAQEPITIAKGATTYTATGLTAGTIYDFDLQSVMVYNGANMLSSADNVKWSPAMRFTTNINSEVIKVYESPSTFGSGLALYDANGAAPKTLKVASGDSWDLGLYTTDNTITFGSAKNILAKYSSYTGTAKTCKISNVITYANSLDEVFDSYALDGSIHTYSEQSFDLLQLQQKSVVFIVETNGPDWNYAKVLVVYNNGFLQSDGGDKYVQMVVSYQKTPGIPYAY